MTKRKTKDPATEGNKNSNVSQDLIVADAEEMVSNIMSVKRTGKKLDKRINFHLYRMFGVKTKTAAKLDGYSVNSGYNLVQKFKNSSKLQHTLAEFIDAMPDHYRSICKARLPLIAEIEGAALAEYRENPKLAINKPTLLRQLKSRNSLFCNQTISTVKLGMQVYPAQSRRF